MLRVRIASLLQGLLSPRQKMLKPGGSLLLCRCVYTPEFCSWVHVEIDKVCRSQSNMLCSPLTGAGIYQYVQFIIKVSGDLLKYADIFYHVPI